LRVFYGCEKKNYTYSIGVVREYLVNILADSLKIPEDKNSFSRSDLNKSESILLIQLKDVSLAVSLRRFSKSSLKC
jgi:hypothetical protein